MPAATRAREGRASRRPGAPRRRACRAAHWQSCPAATSCRPRQRLLLPGGSSRHAIPTSSTAARTGRPRPPRRCPQYGRPPGRRRSACRRVPPGDRGHGPGSRCSSPPRTDPTELPGPPTPNRRPVLQTRRAWWRWRSPPAWVGDGTPSRGESPAQSRPSSGRRHGGRPADRLSSRPGSRGASGEVEEGSRGADQARWPASSRASLGGPGQGLSRLGHVAPDRPLPDRALHLQLDEAVQLLEGNGRTIYFRRIKPVVVGTPKVANQWVISWLKDRQRLCPSSVYHYRAEPQDLEDGTQGTLLFAAGRLRLTSGVTLETGTWPFSPPSWAAISTAPRLRPIRPRRITRP